MGKAIKAVLFDLDGTLLDTQELLRQSFRHVAREVIGRDIPDEVLMAKVGQPLNTQMWDFTQDAAIHERLCREYRVYNALIHDEVIQIFPGTMDMLARLKSAGVLMGIVTSKRHDVAAKGLDCFGIADYFEFLIGCDDWHEHKPSAGPVLHGCELLGLEPEDCLYVGDSPFDIQAGSAAGCATVAVLWGMFSREVLEAENPTYVCEHCVEVAQLAGCV